MSQEGVQPGIGLPPGQVASLTIVRGPDAGERIELTAERTVIGRRQGELVLTDHEVSGLHAAIEAAGGGFVVKDLGSTNGTFVDGEKVTSHALTSGCHIKCGATYLLFELSGPAQEPEPAPAVATPMEASADAVGEPASAPGRAPLGLDEDTPPPMGVPLLPPGAAEPLVAPPAALSPVAPAAFPAPPAPLPEEIPTGIAPPSSVPAPPIPPAAASPPPAAAPIPPAGVPIPPAVVPTSPGAAPTSPGEPSESATPPPRVGVTSHGASAQKPGGTPWDSLALPEEADAPIPPSVGASPLVATPLPGSLQIPPPRDPTPPPIPQPAPDAPVGALPAGVKPSPHDLYLVVEAGADLGKVFPVTEDLTVLGRSDLGVQIHDPDVSRKHVVLELQGPGPHTLRDLGSTNGTLLNGVKVTENLIAPNDIIRMGVTRLKLVAGTEALLAELERIAAG